MISDESSMFYMVANAESQAGMPVNFLTHPPKAVQPDLKTAETEAVRLARITNNRFFILQAVAFVEIDDDGIPRWTEVLSVGNNTCPQNDPDCFVGFGGICHRGCFESNS